MTQEDKQLLLKDLCARLPYGVKAKYRDNTLTLDYTFFADDKSIAFGKYPMIYSLDDVEHIKPFLRPMPDIQDPLLNELDDLITNKKFYEITSIAQDWYNKHHFDYRGLIEKGLALEAPEGMYKID